MKSKLAVMILMICSVLNAQISTFQRTLKASGDEFAGTVLETSNGDFLTVGFSTTLSKGKEDCMSARTNSLGQTIWVKTYGDTARQHFLHAIQDGSSDEYYVVGFSEGRGVKKTDGVFGKINGVGNILWMKAYGGNGDEELRRIVKANDGGFYIMGHSTSTLGAGLEDNYILKVNSTGDIQWTRLFGGSGVERIRSCIKDSIGNLVITGFTNSFGAGNKDVFVVKMSQAGVFKWSYVYGKNSIDKAQDVVNASGGDIVIGGDTKMPVNMNPPTSNAFLMKIDSLGNKKWLRVYQDTSETDLWTVINTNDNGYVFTTDETPLGVTAYSTTDVSYAKVNDATGNISWAHRIGGSKKDKRPDVIRPIGGGYLIVSGTASFASDTMRNLHFVRTNTLGVSGCQTYVRTFVKVDTGFTKGNVNWITATDGSTAAVTWTAVSKTFVHDTLCQNIINTSIASHSNNSKEYKIYPNPSTGKFKLEIDQIEFLVEIRDQLGRLIQTESNRKEFDLRGFENGIYYVTVRAPEATTVSKVIIEN